MSDKRRILLMSECSQIIRKEINAECTTSEFESELRSLGLLKLLRHPNILELLGSYIHSDHPNLIFPLARGGSLAGLLENERSPSFATDVDFFLALAGLASGLHEIHNFAAKELDVVGTGHHHDLKPGNILVEGSRFLIADFGLTKIKQLSSGSETSVKTVHGFYRAPECDEPPRGSPKPTIRRSSDIWSMGCILLEIATYMVGGKRHVEKFKLSREHRLGPVTLFQFHHGWDKESPEVTAWIQSLSQQSTSWGQMLVSLAQRMLHMQQENRPKSKMVESEMRFIAMGALCESISALLDSIVDKNKSIQATLEQNRLRGWMWACGIFSSDRHPKMGTWEENKLPNFQDAIDCLLNIRKELQEILGEPQIDMSTYQAFKPLRILNDRLLETLSTDLRHRATTHLESQMLHTGDSVLLDKMSQELRKIPWHRQLGVLAVVKKTQLLVEHRSVLRRPDLRINFRLMEHMHPCNDFYTSQLADADEGSKVKVLIEWRTFDQNMASERTAKELLLRLEEITGLLVEVKDDPNFRSLCCLGYYLDLAHFACGLVYRFPSSSVDANPDGLTVTTLWKILDSQAEQSVLGHRISLAHSLAASVLRFHQASWLQRNISSFNILFFYPAAAGRSWLDGSLEPRLVGFLNSRPDSNDIFTRGPTDDEAHRAYQHPSYLQGGGTVRYRAEFDIYSLGLVLLEIGLWRSLADIRKQGNVKNDREKLRKNILKYCLPRVGQCMGAIYRGVVEACLEGVLSNPDSSSSSEGNAMEFQFKFHQAVVEPLASCKV